MLTNEQNRLEAIIMELEKRYPLFKKMDIYTIVSNAYKKVHSFFNYAPEKEFEEIRNLAEQDLKLS
jgi:hypothetical protein